MLPVRQGNYVGWPQNLTFFMPSIPPVPTRGVPVFLTDEIRVPKHPNKFQVCGTTGPGTNSDFVLQGGGI